MATCTCIHNLNLYTVLNPQYKKQVDYHKDELQKCQEELKRFQMDLKQVHVYMYAVGLCVHTYVHIWRVYVYVLGAPQLITFTKSSTFMLLYFIISV